jgi:glutaredoxin
LTIQVEIFTAPGCGKCARVKEVLNSVLAGWAGNCIDWHEVDILDELDYAVSLRVLAIPAIAIDGELVFTVSPSARDLRRALEQRIEENVE